MLNPKSTFATVSDVEYYLKQLPQVGFVLDTGNFWFTESDVLEICDRCISRVEHVHIKDIKNLHEDPPRVYQGRGFDSMAIGDGDTPIAAILEKLTQSGYSGTLSIEISSPVRLLEKMGASIKYLRRWTE